MLLVVLLDLMCRVHEPAVAVSTTLPLPLPPIVGRKSLTLIPYQVKQPCMPPLPHHPPNLAPPPIAHCTTYNIIATQRHHIDRVSADIWSDGCTLTLICLEFRCWRPWLDRKGARVYDTFGAFMDSLISRVCMPASADERWSCKVLLAVSIVLWILSHSQCMQTASADEHLLFCASKWLRV